MGVTSSTGIETVHDVAAAVETPTASARGFLGYGVIGFLVGVVPVALGLLWLPSLRRADPRWLAAFMALTAGLLSFLGVESLTEAFTLQALLPGALGGAGLVLLGVAVSALGMTFLSNRLARGRGGTAGLALALLVAIGIGVHNLGEGLAIGTSFAFGELQLGTFLIVGFMVHNVTEGLGIAAPAAEGRRATIAQLLGLAVIAGGPAVLGAWIGGYASNDVLGVLFFGAAAGAALQVVGRSGPLRREACPGRPAVRVGDRRLPRRDRSDVPNRPAGGLSPRLDATRAEPRSATMPAVSLSIAAAQGLWEPAGTYLNTASFGLPPRPAWDAMQSALDDWRTGRTSWEHWGDATEAARESYARLVGCASSSVAVGATVSGLVGLVAASLPDGSRVLAPEVEFTSTLFPFLVQERRGVAFERFRRPNSRRRSTRRRTSSHSAPFRWRPAKWPI